jgi:hypothetical protein
VHKGQVCVVNKGGQQLGRTTYRERQGSIGRAGWSKAGERLAMRFFIAGLLLCRSIGQFRHQLHRYGDIHIYIMMEAGDVNPSLWGSTAWTCESRPSGERLKESWGIGQRRRLDGEGVFEVFHARRQVLDFALLFCQEEVCDAVNPCRHLPSKGLGLVVQCVHVLLAGCSLEALVDHCGRLVNDDVCFYQMYSRIDGQRRVDSEDGERYARERR